MGLGLWVGDGGKCFGLRAGDTVFQLQGGFASTELDLESTEMSTSGGGDVSGGEAEMLGSREVGEVGFLRIGEAVVGAEESMVHNEESEEQQSTDL